MSGVLEALGISPHDIDLLRDRNVPLNQPMPFDPSSQVPGSAPAVRIGDIAGMAMQSAPGVGDAYSVLQAIKDLEDERYASSVLNGIGALPMVAGAGVLNSASVLGEDVVARAKALGFNTDRVLYRGSTSPEHPAPSRAGMAEMMGVEGVHLAEDPAFASLYAEKPGGNVAQYFIRDKDVLDGSALTKEGSREHDIIKALLKGTGQKPYVSEGLLPPVQNYIDAVSPRKAEKVLKSFGVTGVKYKAKYGSLSDGGRGMYVTAKSPAYVLFDSADLRSIYDPFEVE